MLRGLRAVCLGVLGGMAGALQANDACQEVYTQATAHEERSVRDAVSARFIFEQHCSSSGSVKSFHLSVGTSAVFGGLADAFNLGAGSQSQRLEQFCKTFQSSVQARESVVSYRRNVVVDALALFNQCQALRAEGVRVSQRWADKLRGKCATYPARAERATVIESGRSGVEGT